MGKQVVIEIDCLGDICPLPIMKFQNIETFLKEGNEIKIITDHSCAAENVINYCKLHHYKLRIEEPISGVWEIFVNPE